MTRVLIGGIAAILVACGSARVISHEARSGTLELHGNLTNAMEEANDKMVKHCGLNNYTVRKEGHETVEGSSVWRVHYECNTAILTPIVTPEGSGSAGSGSSE